MGSAKVGQWDCIDSASGPSQGLSGCGMVIIGETFSRRSRTMASYEMPSIIEKPLTLCGSRHQLGGTY